MNYNTTAFMHNHHYQELSNDFQKFHQNPINVALHFFTTPLGMIGVFSLLRTYTKSSSTNMFLVTLYLGSLLPILPTGEFIGTVLLCGAILLLARTIKLNLLSAAIVVGVGYLVQDLSHMGTGEKTFQGSYSGANGHVDFQDPMHWLQHFAEHCYYLLPLCVHVAMPFLHVTGSVAEFLQSPMPESMTKLHVFGWLLGPLIVFAYGSYNIDSRNNFCFFPGTPYFYRVVRCNLKDKEPEDTPKDVEQRIQDMKTIRKWTMDHDPSETTSTHFWFKELPGDTKQAFYNIAHSAKINKLFRSLFADTHYNVDVLSGMNEIYVSGPAREAEAANSDHVFYSRHVDGPFGFIPFVSVYRCIVGLDRNMMITTHYPIAGVDVNACEGDVIAFDFNREVHYITRDDSKKDISDKFRVTLKLHYCVYPRTLAPLGWLMGYMNTVYNMSFRALFLKTLKPTSHYEHFLAWNVNFNTFLFDRIETLLGLRNVCYLISLAGIWWATGIYELFFALTSFVHYFRYISTFYVRRNIDFGSFKRDVLLLKTIALIQLFYHYFFPANGKFELDMVSLGMIITGYTVSMMATNAIGVDRTYFAAELGLVEPKWIEKFPYGYIPHPMIVSQMFALLGFHKAAHFREQWPYVVPIHLCLYTIHMLQEHFDIYKRYPTEKVKAT